MDEQILTRLYQAFDAGEAADSGFYVPTESARGNEALSQTFLSRLSRSARPLNFVFSGHIGGGKTSEIKHLASCLRRGHQRVGQKRYFPITVDILDYVDIADVSTTDIQLAIVSQIAATFREDLELRIELKDSLLTAIFEGISDNLPSGVAVDELGVSLGAISAKVKLLRLDRAKRQKVREALDRQPSEFLFAVNAFLQEAKLAVREKGFEDIVVLVDSLDRIMRSKDQSDRQSSFRSLFLDSSPAFTEMRVHKLLTLPLSLVRAHGPQLAQRYDRRPFVLPLIKVENRNHERYDEGYAVFEALVDQRIQPFTNRSAVFADGVLELLVRSSGGHPRSFTRLVSESVADAEDLPITKVEADRAINAEVQMLVPAVRMRWWPILVALELSDDQKVDEDNPDIQGMLEETILLEYRNGHDFEDREEAAPWYAVHPIIRELRSFQERLSEEREKRLGTNRL